MTTIPRKNNAAGAETAPHSTMAPPGVSHGKRPAVSRSGAPLVLAVAAMIALAGIGTTHAQNAAQPPAPATGTTPAPAMTDAALEARVHLIADQLRCPTCQGISVNDSEASFSVQIKDKVRRMLQEGQNDEQIKAYFVSRYGEWILRAPRKEGLGLVLWILPGALIVLVGGLLLYRVHRNQQQLHAGAEEAAPEAKTPRATGGTLTPEQRERILRDLKRFEEQD